MNELLIGQMVLLDHDDGLYDIREITGVFESDDDDAIYYEVEGEDYLIPYFDADLYDDEKDFENEMNQFLYGVRL